MVGVSLREEQEKNVAAGFYDVGAHWMKTMPNALNANGTFMECAERPNL